MLKQIIYLSLFVATQALAANPINLKKVNVVEGNQVEFVFDGIVDSSQVKTEYVRDHIQLSLNQASVYPAKVSMISGSELTKVFAYQYSPSLVRARISVKGEASDYANRLQIKIQGKTIKVVVQNHKKEEVNVQASSALRVASQNDSGSRSEEKSADSSGLIEKIKATETAVAEQREAAAAEKAKKVEKSVGSLVSNSEKKEPLAKGKPLPSPLRSIGVLLVLLGGLGLFVMFLKRIKNQSPLSSSEQAKGIRGMLQKWSGGSNRPLIEVIANHHLAPKRSIVVVRIQERMLVLGMTNDSINLITEFRSNDEGEPEENIGIGEFAANLKKFEEGNTEATQSRPISAKANLGDIAAAALGLAKPKGPSAPRANAAASAYQSIGKNVDAVATSGSGATAAGGPVFSPALSATLSEPAVKQSIRAQIKNRVQGMKQL